jgi:hypothetical protein
MHASFSELLSLRDAEPTAVHVAQHVDQCPQCTRELQQLSTARSRLRELPLFDAPPDAWARIRRRVAGPAEKAARPNRIAAAAAAAFSLLAALILVIRIDGSQTAAVIEPQPRQASAAAPAEPPVATLIAQSQELEQLLQALPQRPLIERVSTAATLDAIEQRIQWLDFQLSYAPEGSFDDAQAQRLWRERVELMDSLVKVRYAEAKRMSF